MSSIHKLSYGNEAQVEFKNGEYHYSVVEDNSIFGAKKTSFLSLINKVAGRIPDPLVIDFLRISTFVYQADKLVMREYFKDNWTRKVSITVPVSDVNLWEMNKETLTEAISFLSGDSWDFEFTHDKSEYNRTRVAKPLHTGNVSLFSGGMDSFIGAIDLLNQNKGQQSQVWFVGHASGGGGIQKLLYEKLKNHFKARGQAEFFPLRFTAASIYKNKLEPSTRSRSILFIGGGLSVASGMYDDAALIIPENGLISLNNPLTSARNGSCSTRTTHPYFIGKLNELLTGLGLKHRIELPYRFMTKGEMMIQCADQKILKKNISTTMSCSHRNGGRILNRIKNTNPNTDGLNCGYCVPCMIRYASFHAAAIPEDSPFAPLDSYTPDVNKDTYRDRRAFFMALERQKNWTDADYLYHVANSGQLPSNDLKAYAEVYKRGIQEVKGYLDAYKISD